MAPENIGHLRHIGTSGFTSPSKCILEVTSYAVLVKTWFSDYPVIVPTGLLTDAI